MAPDVNSYRGARDSVGRLLRLPQGMTPSFNVKQKHPNPRKPPQDNYRYPFPFPVPFPSYNHGFVQARAPCLTVAFLT